MISPRPENCDRGSQPFWSIEPVRDLAAARAKVKINMAAIHCRFMTSAG
jgi:hypothetical protein